MIPRRKMIQAIQSAAGKKRGTPTEVDWDSYKSDGDPSVTTIIRFFGSWNLAMRESGLTPNRQGDRWRQMRW